MNNLQKRLYLLFLVFIAVLIGAGFYYLYIKNNSSIVENINTSTQPTQNNNPVVSNKSNVKADINSELYPTLNGAIENNTNWRAYSNQEYGFRVNYPPYLTLTEYNITGPKELLIANLDSDSGGKDSRPYIFIGKVNAAQNSNSDLITTIKNLNKDLQTYQIKNKILYTPLSVGGFDALMVDGISTIEGTDESQLYFSTEQGVFFLDGPAYFNVTKEIFKTLKKLQ
ncbi:MAG: hypothetical protein Q7S75_00295 [bacterium]|nr:hypothetical protein [bacterium]